MIDCRCRICIKRSFGHHAEHLAFCNRWPLVAMDGTALLDDENRERDSIRFPVVVATPQHRGWPQLLGCLKQCGIRGTDVTELRRGEDRAQSGLIFAARTTLPHLSVSLAMSLANSAGVIGIGVPPRSASRSLILGSARPALTSLLSLSIFQWAYLSARRSRTTPLPHSPARIHPQSGRPATPASASQRSPPAHAACRP
jgi:hypothetical protein